MVIKGWDFCVSTMLSGEKCKLKLTSEYAYGSEGSATGGSINIPSDAAIEFEMELVNFEKVFPDSKYFQNSTIFSSYYILAYRYNPRSSRGSEQEKR